MHLSRASECDRENQRISMRTSLEFFISFDLIVTSSIMQSTDESVSMSVNRQCQGAVFDLSVLEAKVEIELWNVCCSHWPD